jgi:hypothetical protein
VASSAPRAGVIPSLLVPASDARALRRSIAVLVFAVVAYFVPGASWSPVSRYCLTRAIVERHTFDITPCAPATGDRASVGDRFYTDKAPLPSLIAAPAYAAFYGFSRVRHRLPAFQASGTPDNPAQRVIVSPAFRTGLYVSSLFSAGLAAAGLAWALFDVLSRRVSREAATLGTLATLLGTPLFPYATSLFGHTMAAAFLFGAFALVDPRRADHPASHDMWAGALLALAIGTEYVASVPALLIAGSIVLRTSREERWAIVKRFGIGALGPLAVIAAYHGACFGSPLRTGYAFVTHPAFAGGQAQGFFGITFVKPEALFGILFGRSRGLFYVSPVALAGVIAGIRVLRVEKDPALVVGGLVFTALVLINASYYLWDGGRALGPRHVVPALGFVGVGVGYAFERFRTTAALLAGISITIMVLATAVSLEVPESRDVIFGYTIPAIRRGAIAIVSGASNLGLFAGLDKRASLIPVFALIIGGGMWLLRSSEPKAVAPT